MNDFAKTLGIDPLLRERCIDDIEGRNFEDVFAELYANNHAALPEIEQEIENYFSKLELPDEPTIYDYLMLCLRDIDAIATFNWDPFLVQARRRNQATVRLIFLHGNVAVGYCAEDRVLGLRNNRCSHCSRRLEPSKLLYPIKTKDYASDPHIAAQWTAFRSLLDRALMLTIFGYSAPASDVEAVEAIQDAWGRAEDRDLEEIEMIDIRPEADVKASWEPLIHTHHYTYHTSYFDSWLGQQGPRAMEQFVNQVFEAQFIDANPVPQNISLEELRAWCTRVKEQSL